MEFLGNAFGGLKKALLKCIGNSATKKEVEKNAEPKVHEAECGHVNEAEEQSADANKLSHSYLENTTCDSDSPSDFSSSYEKVDDEDLCHEYADNHESIMDDVFRSTENKSASFSTSAPKEETLADEIDGSKTWTLNVCCKLADKLPTLNVQRNHSRYIYLGIQPDILNCDMLIHIEFEESHTSLKKTKSLRKAILAMKQRGFTISTYRVKNSQCLVLLFDLSPARHIVERYRFELQRDAGILIPLEDTAAADALAFSYLIAEFVAQFSQHPMERGEELPTADKEKIRVVFHDWFEAIAMIFLHLWKIEAEKIYHPETATPNDASSPMHEDHRLEIENFAREVASEIIHV